MLTFRARQWISFDQFRAQRQHRRSSITKARRLCLQPVSNGLHPGIDRHQIATFRTAGVTAMDTPPYDKSISALLVVDPYNDFISEGGKIWPRIKAVAEANGCVSNMLKVLNAARAVKLRVFYAMHHRYRAGDYETWTYIAPIQRGTWE